MIGTGAGSFRHRAGHTRQDDAWSADTPAGGAGRLEVVIRFFDPSTIK
jgi:hypothetical protein